MPVKFHLELSLTAVLTDGIIPDKFLPYLDWLCDSFQQHLFPIRGWSDLLKEVRILTQLVVKPETKKKRIVVIEILNASVNVNKYLGGDYSLLENQMARRAFMS